MDQLSRLFTIGILVVVIYIGYRLLVSTHKNDNKRNNTTKLCPKCGAVTKMGRTLIMGLTPVRYRCPKCGYGGVFVDVEKKNIKHVRNQIRKRK